MTDEKRLTQGYNKMMERVRAYYTSAAGTESLDDAVTFARDQAVSKGELDVADADKIAGFVRRDVVNAADFMAETDRSLADWFKFDIEMIEARLWEWFSEVADQTKLELQALEQRARLMSEYHTGEVSGPATLQCGSCKRLINLTDTAHVPPCPSCKHTVFTRYAFDDDE